MPSWGLPDKLFLGAGYLRNASEECLRNTVPANLQTPIRSGCRLVQGIISGPDGIVTLMPEVDREVDETLFPHRVPNNCKYRQRLIYRTFESHLALLLLD